MMEDKNEIAGLLAHSKVMCNCMDGVVVDDEGAPEGPCQYCYEVDQALASLQSDERVEEVEWQRIETAPKGGGAEVVTDPDWVAPPSILLLCENGEQIVGFWDWYYAESGNGFAESGGCAWVESLSSELIHLHCGSPIGWIPLPEAKRIVQPTSNADSE